MTTKLILEEAGKRRAFNVSEGVLTVGSGAGVKLRLESPGIAEVHLELEVADGKLRVTPRPGVLPPKVDGSDVAETTELAPGQRVTLGEVALWFEVEGQAPAAAPPARPSTAKPAPATPGRVVPKNVATPGRNRSQVKRSRPRVKRGLPGSVIAGLILVGVAVVVAFVIRGVEGQAEKGGGPVWASIAAAEQELEQGNLRTALLKLDRIPAASEMTPAEEERIASLREQIATRNADADLAVANLTGTKYLEVMLRKYERNWLAGEPQPAKVRFFLKRLAEFRRRWPQHPDMAWVDRQESRFRGFVDLAAPPTWDDVAWEIKYCREQPVRDYKAAFELLAEFEPRASADEEELLEELRAEMIPERAEYHEDRIQQARYEFDRKDDPAKAVWWLLNLTVYIGDEEMADEAATFLAKMPNLVGHLRAYEQQYPERYRLVLEHPIVRKAAEEQGLNE